MSELIFLKVSDEVSELTFLIVSDEVRKLTKNVSGQWSGTYIVSYLQHLNSCITYDIYLSLS